MRYEDKFPTVRFLKCKACGKIYTGSLTGDNACPDCLVPAETGSPAAGRISKRIESSHALFNITGTLYKIGELEELKAQIDQALEEEIGSIAFLFEGSSFLNSSTINLLVKTMQTLSVRGKPTFIITDDKEVLESLQMMDLDRVMRICPDLERYKTALTRGTDP